MTMTDGTTADGAPYGASPNGATARPPSPAQEMPVSEPERAWQEFSIHGRATMRVACDAPTAPQLSQMFEPFLVEGSLGERFDLTITGDFEAMPGVSHAEDDYRYSESGLYLNRAKVQILFDSRGVRLNGTRELLTTALPLLDQVLVRRGVAMIHAATVDYRGHGVALPAWGGTGKTSAIAKLMRLDGVSFMGDDWAFLDVEGQLLGYAKPMFIKPHHRALYPHVFTRSHKPLVPSALSRTLSSITTMVHPLVTQFPRLASVSRRWSPEHIMIRAQDALPHARISTRAPLVTAVFVERCEGARVVVEERSRPWMRSRLIGNFHAEITAHSQEVMTALGATGLVSLEETFAEKAAIIDSALGELPVFLLQVPRALEADAASDAIVEQLERILAHVGVADAGQGAPVLAGAGR